MHALMELKSVDILSSNNCNPNITKPKSLNSNPLTEAGRAAPDLGNCVARPGPLRSPSRQPHLPCCHPGKPPPRPACRCASVARATLSYLPAAHAATLSTGSAAGLGSTTLSTCPPPHGHGLHSPIHAAMDTALGECVFSNIHAATFDDCVKPPGSLETWDFCCTGLGWTKWCDLSNDGDSRSEEDLIIQHFFAGFLWSSDSDWS